MFINAVNGFFLDFAIKTLKSYFKRLSCIHLFGPKMFSALFLIHSSCTCMAQTCQFMKDKNDYFRGKMHDYNKVVGWCIIIK